MSEKKTFSLKELVYLIPGLFGLFLVFVMVFPFLIILGFLAQEFGAMPVSLVLAGLLHLVLAVVCLARLAYRRRTRLMSALLALFFVSVPLLGPVAFLLHKQPRYPRSLS